MMPSSAGCRWTHEFSQTYCYALVSVFVSMVMLSGCDTDWSVSTNIVKVQGKVSLDGKPLDQARLVFLPIESIADPITQLGEFSYGLTDGEGKYELKQSDGTLGVKSGLYWVMISKPAESSSKEQETESRDSWARDDLSFGNESDDAVPDFYRRHGYLKVHVIAMPGGFREDFELSTVDPLLK